MTLLQQTGRKQTRGIRTRVGDRSALPWVRHSTVPMLRHASRSYYRARYYDPQSGRFVGEDPLRFLSGGNFYAYVHNNSPNSVDPTGLCDQKPCRLSISCQPVSAAQSFTHCNVTVQNGSTYTAYDAMPSGSIWWSKIVVTPGKGAPPGSNTFAKDMPVPCDCAEKAAKNINSSGMTYNFILQNSNTAAQIIANGCGVSPTFPPRAWGANVSTSPDMGKFVSMTY